MDSVLLNDKALIAHVHVPKTAGSAINSILRRYVGRGRDHIQGLLDDTQFLPSLVSENLWLAGHIPAPRFHAALDRLGTRARFITSLREPVAHVASHYNWLIEIGHRGEAFLNGHPPDILEIHQRIKSSDNSDPSVVIRNLTSNPGLFLNCQASYIVGAGVAADEARFAEALAQFDALIFSDDLAGGLNSLILNEEIRPDMTNSSSYHFDKSVFKTPELRDFLAERNSADALLWRVANEHFRLNV